MTRSRSSRLRRTAICIATALAVSLPGIATAGIADKAKARAQSAKAKAGTVLSIVREKRPALDTALTAAQDLPSPAEIFEILRELELAEEFRGAMEIARQMNADYAAFSPERFRAEVKALLDDYLWLADSVPVMKNRTGLLDNMRRALDLIDHVPPRALYLMSQALGDQLAGLGAAADNMRQALAALPPFVEAADIWAYASLQGAADAGDPICAWVGLDSKPFVGWLKAELGGIAWSLKTAEGLIPNPEVKVEGGGEAGIAVANATAAAGTTVKPLQPLHNALKAAAVIPEGIGMAIDLNIARAKLVCAAVDLAQN